MFKFGDIAEIKQRLGSVYVTGHKAVSITSNLSGFEKNSRGNFYFLMIIC
jgi:hypothetical protein